MKNKNVKKKKNKKYENYYKINTTAVNTKIKAKSGKSINKKDIIIPNITRAGKSGIQLDTLKQTEILYLYPHPSEDKPLFWSKQKE